MKGESYFVKLEDLLFSVGGNQVLDLLIAFSKCNLETIYFEIIARMYLLSVFTPSLDNIDMRFVIIAVYDNYDVSLYRLLGANNFYQNFEL